MQAVLLAGGMGTRLRAVVADRPKPMAEVAGEPFLAHLLRRLGAQGVEQAVLAVGYLHEQIVAHFGARFEGMALRYAIEREPLGTGGAMREGLRLVDAAHALVLNADTWLEADLASAHQAHLQGGCALTMLVRPVDDVARFGAVEVVGGRVRGFREKGRRGAGLINAGCYLMRRGLLEGLDLPERFSFETDCLAPLAAREPVAALEVRGDFIDIGVPEDYARAQQYFAARQGG